MQQNEVREPAQTLTISKAYAGVAAAEILHLHRHQDGYISFATERDDEDFLCDDRTL